MRHLAALLPVYFTVLGIVCASDLTALRLPAVAAAAGPSAHPCHEPAAPAAPALPTEETPAGGSACERHCASLATAVPLVHSAALTLVAAAWAPLTPHPGAPAPTALIRSAAPGRYRAPPDDLVLRHACFLL